MAKYIDGFVIPVAKNKVGAYKKMAQWGAKTWMKYGALDYYECVGDDLDVKHGVPFPKQLKLKKGETVIFAFIVFKSRAHRDKVNAKVMSDPAMTDFDPSDMPIDIKRMVYGGFTTLVEG